MSWLKRAELSKEEMISRIGKMLEFMNASRLEIRDIVSELRDGREPVVVAADSRTRVVKWPGSPVLLAIAS